MAELFKENNLNYTLSQTLQKLRKNQLPSGAWSWFKGMRENRYISQYILTGFSRLIRFNSIDLNKNYVLKQILRKGIEYCDHQIQKDYHNFNIYF